MEKGMEVQVLTEMIQDYEDKKKDLIAPTKLLEYCAEDDVVKVQKHDEYKVSNLAHNQIAGRLKIPMQYYNRMKADAPDLLERNINHWFQNASEKRMIRTYSNGENILRAFLSDRFKTTMSNALVAQAALPVLLNMGDAIQIKSCSLTDARLYIQAICPGLSSEVTVGDIVQAGITIRNSEVGLGKFAVELLIWRLACENGMITSDSISKYHVGRRIDSEDDEVTHDFYKQETVEAEEHAFFMKVRDTVDHAFNDGTFNQAVDAMKSAAGHTIEAKDLEDVVENVTKKYSFSKEEGKNILASMIDDHELSQYGVANAITRQAHDITNFDRAYDYEKIGGRVVNLSGKEWRGLVRI